MPQKQVSKGSTVFAQADRAWKEEHDLDKAIRLFLTAIQQNQRTESAINSIAQIYEKQGKYQEAITFLQQYRGMKSVDNSLVRMYVGAKQFEQAMALLKTQIEHEKDYDRGFTLRNQLAHCFMQQGDYLQARQTYTTLLGEQPNNIAVKRNLASCLYQQGNLDEATTTVNQILQHAPEDINAAQLLEKIQRAKEAMENLDKIEVALQKIVATRYEKEYGKSWLTTLEQNALSEAKRIFEHARDQRKSSSGAPLSEVMSTNALFGLMFIEGSCLPPFLPKPKPIGNLYQNFSKMSATR